MPDARKMSASWKNCTLRQAAAIMSLQDTCLSKIAHNTHQSACSINAAYTKQHLPILQGRALHHRTSRQKQHGGEKVGADRNLVVTENNLKPVLPESTAVSQQMNYITCRQGKKAQKHHSHCIAPRSAQPVATQQWHHP